MSENIFVNNRKRNHKAAKWPMAILCHWLHDRCPSFCFQHLPSFHVILSCFTLLFCIIFKKKFLFLANKNAHKWPKLSCASVSETGIFEIWNSDSCFVWRKQGRRSASRPRYITWSHQHLIDRWAALLQVIREGPESVTMTTATTVVGCPGNSTTLNIVAEKGKGIFWLKCCEQQKI